MVGGGGGLTRSGHGRSIDAHDLVFRVNVALTKGFERDVGSRTTFVYTYPGNREGMQEVSTPLYNTLCDVHSSIHQSVHRSPIDSFMFLRSLAALLPLKCSSVVTWNIAPIHPLVTEVAMY